MAILSRIAVGSVQPQVDTTAVVWALMEILTRRGRRVQSFLSHAYFCPRDGATAITGLPVRQLDSWVMSRSVCRETFVRGYGGSDLALVEGAFSKPGNCCHVCESNFEALCAWLDLPRLAVINARKLSPCRVPDRPMELDGIVFDAVRDTDELARLQTQFEALWKVPVVGWLGELPALRDAISQIDCGRQPSLDLCRELGDAFERQSNITRIVECAASRPWRETGASRLAPPSKGKTGVRIAVAYDEAFRGYFPDTLEVLEQRGAKVIDFSPLHDECLPSHTDIVYIGCGHPERFARQLSENDCLILSLKGHASRGGRIYGECGGLAFLCQALELPDGQRWPMAGILPATARYDSTAEQPTPAEVCLTEDNWLGKSGQKWRGYVSPRWSLLPSDQLHACSCELGHECDVVTCHQAVGSRLYLHLASQSEMLNQFLASRPVLTHGTSG